MTTTTTDPSTSTTIDESTGSFCGDGVMDAPIEECDDGNQVEGDGCDALCQVEQPDKQKRFVFLSSASYTGVQVNKIDNADVLCDSLASKSPVPGLQMRKFKAWLSDGSTHAIDRIGSYEGEYVLVNGTVLASGSQAFKVAALKAMINVTETGMQVPWLMAACNSSADGVWTGTQADGTADSANCNNWTSDRGTGMIGAFGATDGNWTGCAPRNCAEPFRLYCIEVE
ncbi:DUF4215 domain-containing protein [Nannocystis pusilla]|uniref:DUF4215 domain-containing protein n=1 Tax=Nannocystis pusilla TaxID=889268 RepID=UPI003B7DE21B